MLDLGLLNSFLAVVEGGGFRVAARRLGVSQPLLSQHLRRLEQELGVPLIERSRRGGAPTPQGQRLLPPKADEQADRKLGRGGRQQVRHDGDSNAAAPAGVQVKIVGALQRAADHAQAWAGGQEGFVHMVGHEGEHAVGIDGAGAQFVGGPGRGARIHLDGGEALQPCEHGGVQRLGGEDAG